MRNRFLERPFISLSLSQEEYLFCIKQVGFEMVNCSLSSFMPKAVETGICEEVENVKKSHLFIYVKK